MSSNFNCIFEFNFNPIFINFGAQFGLQFSSMWLHLGSMGKQKINFGLKKASRFNFNRFFDDFHRFGTSIRELWAPTSFPKSWKNVIFITLLKQCTSSGINHHSKCSQISIAFVFLIWTRCMSEIHQKTLKNTFFVFHFCHFCKFWTSGSKNNLKLYDKSQNTKNVFKGQLHFSHQFCINFIKFSAELWSLFNSMWLDLGFIGRDKFQLWSQENPKFQFYWFLTNFHRCWLDLHSRALSPKSRRK